MIQLPFQFSMNTKFQCPGLYVTRKQNMPSTFRTLKILKTSSVVAYHNYVSQMFLNIDLVTNIHIF